MSEQEKLWAGEFGDKYHKRNAKADRQSYWGRIVGTELADIDSVIEFGAGKGDNLISLRELKPDLFLIGVDINRSACEEMQKVGINALNCSVSEAELKESADLVITRGFLIHVPPSEIEQTYVKLYRSCKRYICIAEYYSPEPRKVVYHGHNSALWTRDFMGEMMDRFPDLTLVRYFFTYRRFGGDDLTWFLAEKRT